MSLPSPPSPPPSEASPAPASRSLNVHLITDASALSQWCEVLRAEPIIAIDVESNGLHAYEASLCVVQIATPTDVLVIDSIAVSVAPLASVFADGPMTVVHDLGFDARMLAKAGAKLVRVADTALAAGLLGRTSTGLASVLASELGVTHDKSLQHADWAARPLGERALAYLAGDVSHLLRLWEVLSAEVDAKGIRLELEEETHHRLGEASEPHEDPRPLFVRMKGIDRARPDDLPLLRALVEARERLARELDVPAYKIVGNDVLFAIAKERPRSLERLERIPGAHRGRARQLSRAFLAMVDAPQAPLSDAEREALTPRRLPEDVRKARKKREEALLAWRKTEAVRREVNLQVVLPGHVLRRLADRGPRTLGELLTIEGLGAFRVERYGDPLLALLSDEDERAERHERKEEEKEGEAAS